MADAAQVVVFEIKEYMVIFRQVETRDFGGIQVKIRGLVRCMGKDPKTGVDYRIEVFFLTPDSPVPPTPIVDIPNHNGAMFFPASDMLTLVDTLRNEKPIFGHLRADRPEWTSITTTNEPVGEGFEKD